MSFNDLVGWANILSTIFGLVSMVCAVIAIWQASTNNFFGIFKDMMNDKLQESKFKRGFQMKNQEETERKAFRKHEISMKTLNMQEQAQKLNAHYTTPNLK